MIFIIFRWVAGSEVTEDPLDDDRLHAWRQASCYALLVSRIASLLGEVVDRVRVDT